METFISLGFVVAIAIGLVAGFGALLIIFELMAVKRFEEEKEDGEWDEYFDQKEKEHDRQ